MNNIDDTIQATINKLLIHIGARPELRGFELLSNTICMMIDNPSHKVCRLPMMYMYEQCGKAAMIPASCVERRLRHITHCIWDNLLTHPKICKEVFDEDISSFVKPDGKFPTNSGTIYLIANTIAAKLSM